MPYGNTARFVTVYQYGTRRDRSHAHATDPAFPGRGEALEAMRERVLLWNRLVELDHTYHVERDALLARVAPNYRELEPAERRAVWRALPDTVRAELQALEERTRVAARALARESVLWWCNSDDVLLAWSQARLRCKRPLRFHRPSFDWRPGKLLVRWQTGLSVAALLAGTDRRALLEVPAPAAVVHPDTARTLRPPVYGRLHLCVRTEGPRHTPVYLTLPLVVHRPLPPEGLVRQIIATCRLVARDPQWQVSLVVEQAAPAPRLTGATVAVDLGWRVRPDGRLRVGWWARDDGHAGELVLPPLPEDAVVEYQLDDGTVVHGLPPGVQLPPRWRAERVDLLRAITHSEGLRALRDRLFNAVRAELTAWCDAQPAEILPEWLRVARGEWAQWRSPGRLAQLVDQWRAQRFAGDEAMFERLREWQLHDHLHLWRYEAHQRQQALARRKWIYEQYAAALLRDARRLVLEQFDLRPVVELDQQAAELPETVRHARVVVAPSVLRQALLRAARARGVEVVQVPAARTTLRCHACGHVAGEQEFDKARVVVHQCVACGRRWDQDYNACRNLLAAGAPAEAANLV